MTVFLLLILGSLVLIAFILFLEDFFSKTLFKSSKKTQKKYLILLVLFFSASLIFIPTYSFRITHVLVDGEAPSFFFFLFFILIIPFFSIYFLLARFPANFAYFFLEILRPDKKFEIRTFWSLLDKIKFRRRLIISFLSLTLFVVFCLTILVGYLAFGRELAMISFLIGAILLFFYFIEEIVGYGRFHVSECQHKKSVDIKNAIENISIKAGIEPPNFKIIINSNPTAFLLCPNFSKPIIFITSSLLNLADRNELKAVVANQIAFISSGRIFDYLTINNLLLFLKICGSLIFLLCLAMLNNIFLFAWLGAVLYFMIRSAMAKFGKGENITGSIGTIISLANPPFLLVNFISHLIFYQISDDEILYADLESIQFTRYPKPLYSVLTKLEEHKNFGDKMPEELYYLYFTGENTAIRSMPMPQPSIKRRKAILEEIDYTLKSLKVTEEFTGLKCPCCASYMEELEGEIHYGGTIKIDRCKRCGSIWFDEWEVWYIADLMPHVLDDTQLKNIIPVDKILCPRCEVELYLVEDYNIPRDVQLWSCPTCNGNLLEHINLIRFSAHKKKNKSVLKNIQ